MLVGPDLQCSIDIDTVSWEVIPLQSYVGDAVEVLLGREVGGQRVWVLVPAGVIGLLRPRGAIHSVRSLSMLWRLHVGLEDTSD